MKASTLFALTIAALLALGVAIGAKQMGLFDKSATTVEEPQGPPKVLVAGTNLYKDIAMTADKTQVVNLQAGQEKYYEDNKDRLLPPIPAAAHLRIPKVDIKAGTIITEDMLEDLKFPKGMYDRVRNKMRAVNVALPKERCAGGLIARGEFVDLLLTSTICSDDRCTERMTQTTLLVRGARVIAKRDQLWTVLQATPINLPVSYTLEVNPYRAALIEFSQTKGLLTMVPTSERPMVDIPISDAGDREPAVSFAIFDSEEYRREDARVDGVMRNLLTVSEADLERIFRLGPIVRTVPKPNTTIRSMSGVNYSGQAVFGPDRQYLGSKDPALEAGNVQGQQPSSKISLMDSPGQKPSMGYRFHIPARAGEKFDPNADCPTCNKP